MSDIVERLRLLVPSDSSGAAFDAVDEITALRAENENLGKGAVEQAAACGRLLRELHAVRAENEKLRAALELFACDCIESGNLCPSPQYCQHYNARAALERK